MSKAARDAWANLSNAGTASLALDDDCIAIIDAAFADYHEKVEALVEAVEEEQRIRNAPMVSASALSATRVQLSIALRAVKEAM